MKLADYIAETGRRQELAVVLNTSTAYLWQLANGWRGRKPSVQLTKRIELATAGQVSRYDLRPDVFGPAPTTADPTDPSLARRSTAAAGDAAEADAVPVLSEAA